MTVHELDVHELHVSGALNRLDQMPSPSNIDMCLEQEVLNWRPPGPEWEGPPPQLVHPSVFSRCIRFEGGLQLRCQRMNPCLFLAAFGVFMQGGSHQLPQGSDVHHAIDQVKVLSRFYDDDVDGIC